VIELVCEENAARGKKKLSLNGCLWEFEMMAAAAGHEIRRRCRK
jgi:hypothetical protein